MTNILIIYNDSIYFLDVKIMYAFIEVVCICERYLLNIWIHCVHQLKFIN